MIDKATSLLSLRDALRNEHYEDCAQLIKTAKRFGTEQSEISEVLAEYLRGLERERPYEATIRVTGRKRF